MTVTHIPAPETPQGAARPKRWFDSLSTRLFAITVASILLVELLIFIPSASGERTDWINQRVEAARIAALALEASPSRMVSQELSVRLLDNAQVIAVAEIEDDMRFQLLAPPEEVMGIPHQIDLRNSTALGRSAAVIGAFFAPQDRLLVALDTGTAEGRVIEVAMPHAPLKAHLRGFAWRILGLSLLIAFVAAGLIFSLLHLLVVRPMQRVTESVEGFRDNPGGWTRRLAPTQRRDEIGRAQNALADMEEAVANAFRERSRLADLGEAVAKINHDLRNSLASAQLVSDMLQKSDDPRVQRAAPRLERALERAIKLATDTLEYGKTRPVGADVQRVDLHAALEEAAFEALGAFQAVAFTNDTPVDLGVDADPDHIHRITGNLMRNAAEAMVSAESDPATLTVRVVDGAIEIADSGPGLPDVARENLFQPFKGSARSKGTGLGLVIARDLAQAMGGDVALADTGPTGTVFRVTLPALAAVTV